MRASRAFVLVLATLAGCHGRGCKRSGTIERDDTGPRADARVQICLDGVRGLTERTDRCEGGREWWGSIDRVVESMRPVCEAMVDAPGSRYERAEIDACNAALRAAPCSESMPEACRIVGSLSQGSPCLFGVQCGKDLYCRPAPMDLCGTCVPLARLGEKCDQSLCDVPLTCIDGVCEKTRAEGEPCHSMADCPRPLDCVGELGKGHICRRLPAIGEPCVEGRCAPSAVCTGSVCVKREGPRKPGEACTDALDCMDFTCVDGTCREPGKIGAPCGDEPGPIPCRDALICHRGKCAVPDARECK